MIFSWKYIRKQVFLAKCGGGNNNNDWQILCRATPNVFIVQEGAAHLCIFVEQCRAIKRSVGDRTWSSFRLKWLFCNDCRPRLLNPLIRLFVVAAPCDGDKLMLLAAAAILLLAPPIDPKLVSILIRGVNLDIYSLDTFIRGRTWTLAARTALIRRLLCTTTTVSHYETAISYTPLYCTRDLILWHRL